VVERQQVRSIGLDRWPRRNRESQPQGRSRDAIASGLGRLLPDPKAKDRDELEAAGHASDTTSAQTRLLAMVLVMIPKGPSLEHVWDDLLIWHKRRRADRVRLQRRQDREFQRRVLLAANVLINSAVSGFFRGVMIGVLVLALLYCMATCGHH
jgi:hypothetical protein